MTHTPCRWRTNSTIPEPHAQGYQFGTNVETIDSYAVPPADQAGGARRHPDADRRDQRQPLLGLDGGRRDLHARRPRHLRQGDGRRRAARPGDAEGPPGQHPADRPGQPDGVGYGLGIAQFAPDILGHDGQIPGYSTFMVYDIKTDDTIIIAANLSASPVTGENAAVELAKTILGTLYGNADRPRGGRCRAAEEPTGPR